MIEAMEVTQQIACVGFSKQRTFEDSCCVDILVKYRISMWLGRRSTFRALRSVRALTSAELAFPETPARRIRPRHWTLPSMQ
jgi:hypothetical protein